MADITAALTDSGKAKTGKEEPAGQSCTWGGDKMSEARLRGKGPSPKLGNEIETWSWENHDRRTGF